MLTAKPIEAFTLGKRRILSCEVKQGNPNHFLNKELWFYSFEGCPKQVRVEGVSTASDMQRDVYDFHYSGALILPDEIKESSLLTDASPDMKHQRSPDASPKRR